MSDQIEGFMPPDIGDDDHIIRRLGWALVKGWKELPKPLQDRLQERAVFTHDDYETTQLNEQISIFLRKHG